MSNLCIVLTRYREKYIRNSTSVIAARFSERTLAKARKESKYTVLNRLFHGSRRRAVRYGFLTANLVVLGAVGAFVALGPNSANQSNLTSQSLLAAGREDTSNPLDKLSSADIAVNVARVTRMDEANSVANKADTARADLDVSASEDRIIAKPQIMSETLKSKKDIKTYVVVAGDTITSIAQKFGISSETIRISNGLTGDTVAVGSEIVISPVDGIVYTVKDGDTPEALAARYRASKDQLIAFNDAELTGRFNVGDRIVIPDGLAPVVASRYTYASGGFSWGGNAPVYSPNGYDYGWCTWHAANRRSQTGRPVPSNLGNAVSWLGLARRAGLPTGDKPQAGAVLYHTNLGGLGHVAYVESVNPDGSYLVSDMNYPSWGRVTYRTVPSSETGNYRFIY